MILKKVAFLILAFFVTVSAARICTAEDAHTPPFGSAERKSILNAMRADILDKFDLHVVFVVKWLTVKDGWAWAETHPQSRDGLNRYEPYLALLEKREGVWAIVEVPPLEEDSPPVDDLYFEGLLERFPAIPRDIFPWGR